MDILTIISSLASISIAVIALIISILTYRRHSKVDVKIRAPLVLWLENWRETLPTLSFASFPFSSLEDGIEHLKWIPIEIHNESQSKSISVNLVWIEVFNYPPNEVFERMSQRQTGLLKVNTLEVAIKEHLPISIEAGSCKTIHVSIKTAAEIWKNHIHRIGVLRVRHSFGTTAIDPINLDLLWEYYSYVAHFVSQEVLRKEVERLKHSKMQADKLIDYANSIYERLGFVPQLGVVELSWILKEKAVADSFFKSYLARTEDRLKILTRQTETIYQTAIQRGEVKAPKKGEMIPICIVAKALPKNIESTLELIEELENKIKSS